MDSVRYLFHGIWEEYSDPRTSPLPLLHGGPWKVLGIVSLYLYFVKIWGPAYMKGREAFDLRPFMLIYNGFLIGFNGIGFVFSLWLTDWGVGSWRCAPIDPNTKDFKANLIVYFGWMYFISKIADFMDTVFFVLRKKENQASFLHVFHHGVMPLIGYFGVKFYPGGYSCFLPVTNVLVHAVMYSYYSLAACGGEMRQYLWWKKHITQLQMVQFIFTFFHSLKALVMPNCWPTWLAFCEGVHATIFFLMFFSFYMKAYGGRSAPSQVKKK